MQKLVLAVLAAWSCAAFAGPAEEAMAVVQKWAKAFADSDVDAIVRLHAPDALFYGTQSPVLVTRPEGIRKYFEAALLTDRPRGASLGEHSVQVVSDKVVVVTGADLVTGVRDGQPTASAGRTSFVIADRGQGWQIVHFHRSQAPKPKPAP